MNKNVKFGYPTLSITLLIITFVCCSKQQHINIPDNFYRVKITDHTVLSDSRGSEFRVLRRSSLDPYDNFFIFNNGEIRCTPFMQGFSNFDMEVVFCSYVEQYHWSKNLPLTFDTSVKRHTKAFKKNTAFLIKYDTTSLRTRNSLSFDKAIYFSWINYDSTLMPISTQLYYTGKEWGVGKNTIWLETNLSKDEFSVLFPLYKGDVHTVNVKEIQWKEPRYDSTMVNQEHKNNSVLEPFYDAFTIK